MFRCRTPLSIVVNSYDVTLLRVSLSDVTWDSIASQLRYQLIDLSKKLRESTSSNEYLKYRLVRWTAQFYCVLFSPFSLRKLCFYKYILLVYCKYWFGFWFKNHDSSGIFVCVWCEDLCECERTWCDDPACCDVTVNCLRVTGTDHGTHNTPFTEAAWRVPVKHKACFGLRHCDHVTGDVCGKRVKLS